MPACKGSRTTSFMAIRRGCSSTGSIRHSSSHTCVNVAVTYLLRLHENSQIICPIPATILSKLFPPRIWLGGAAVGWGVCAVLMVSRTDQISIQELLTKAPSRLRPSTSPAYSWLA